MPWNDDTGPVPRRSEAELLAMARQKADATDERSRLQLRTLSGVVAVVLVIGVMTAVDRSGDDPTTQLRTTSGDVAQTSPSTTEQPAPSTVTSSTTSTAPAPSGPTSTVTTSRAAGSSTSTSRPPAPTSTTRACRNSFEPACGPFRWDPPVPPNQPLTVKVTYAPATPKIGETVTFRVVVDDPDGSTLLDRTGIANGYGDGPPLGAPRAHRDCLESFGPWTPGSPEPVHADLTFPHVYANAGTYVASFPFKSLGDCTYGPSEATGSVTVTVTL